MQSNQNIDDIGQIVVIQFMCSNWNYKRDVPNMKPFVYHEWSWIQNCFVPIEGQSSLRHLYSFADDVMMTSSWLVKVQFGHINNEIPRISNIGFDGNHHLYHACSKLIEYPHQIGSKIIPWHVWTNQMSPKIVSRDYLAFIEGFWNIFNLWATG